MPPPPPQKSYYFVEEVINKPIIQLKKGGRIIYVPKHWLGKQCSIDSLDKQTFIVKKHGTTAKITVTSHFSKEDAGKIVTIRLLD